MLVKNKKSIKPEYFNVGKTQFYKILKEIKKEKYMFEKEENIYLNSSKIEDYLRMFLI